MLERTERNLKEIGIVEERKFEAKPKSNFSMKLAAVVSHDYLKVPAQIRFCDPYGKRYQNPKVEKGVGYIQTCYRNRL